MSMIATRHPPSTPFKLRNFRWTAAQSLDAAGKILISGAKPKCRLAELSIAAGPEDLVRISRPGTIQIDLHQTFRSAVEDRKRDESKHQCAYLPLSMDEKRPSCRE
jgi:hypothetical protein